jgi:methylmalonyl-CoA mutase
MFYEHKKHDGSFPIIGVNTFLGKEPEEPVEIELARSSEEEKQSQIARLHKFQDKNAKAAEQALAQIRQAVINNENGFEALMEAVRYCSLGQITQALFEVGGQYRRSM